MGGSPGRSSKGLRPASPCMNGRGMAWPCPSYGPPPIGEGSRRVRQEQLWDGGPGPLLRASMCSRSSHAPTVGGAAGRWSALRPSVADALQRTSGPRRRYNSVDTTAAVRISATSEVDPPVCAPGPTSSRPSRWPSSAHVATLPRVGWQSAASLGLGPAQNAARWMPCRPHSTAALPPS